MLSRRKLLKRLGTLPLVGGALGAGIPLSSAQGETLAAAPKRNVIKELGLRSFVNAAGTYTAMTASLMPDEVMQTINFSSDHYIMLDEVQDKVGEKIAELCHAEYATVTAGCWSAMVLGTAGVLTGKDRKKISQLPDLTGMKSQVIVQKSHNTGYVHALTNTGVEIVEVETAADVDRAVNDKTAMMWFLNYQGPAGKIKHEEWVALAKKHGLPTMIDMAADVPPVENLWKYNDLGFDLVCVSGGKAIRGPQSAGILMGRRDLVEAARLSAPPRGGTIGRGMKVNKEEILGMYVALDTYIKKDHDKEWKEWEDKIAHISDAVSGIESVSTDVSVPEVANHTPYLQIGWDPNIIKLDQGELRKRLREGSPSIEVISGGDNAVKLTVFMLRPKEEKIVAKRIAEELQKAKV